MMESAELERRLVEFFARNAEDAAAVYLFGSAVRGTARPDSGLRRGEPAASRFGVVHP